MKFDIEAILDKTDLIEYVRKAGGNIQKHGSSWSCACPLHGGDNPSAFSVYTKNGRLLWNCYTGACGGGDAIRFIQKWMNFDFIRACEWINGGKIEDAVGLKVSAEQRMEKARIEAIEAEQIYHARITEFQKAERHLIYHQYLKDNQWLRDMWTGCGIDEGMQDFWCLGGCADFAYEDYHTPTMTIPILSEFNDLLNIQHRLVNPKDPKSKYRYDRKGLHADPFLAVPAMGYDGDYVIVMEGSKKAMVTWTRSDSGWQTIGAPSQTIYKSLIEKLKPVGKRVVVVPDPNSKSNPNAWRMAYELAAGVSGYFMPVPIKFDDYIIQADLKTDELHRMILQARKA